MKEKIKKTKKIKLIQSKRIIKNHPRAGNLKKYPKRNPNHCKIKRLITNKDKNKNLEMLTKDKNKKLKMKKEIQKEKK